MQTCPGFLKKSLLEYPGNLLEICSVKSVDTLVTSMTSRDVNMYELTDLAWWNRIV